MGIMKNGHSNDCTNHDDCWCEFGRYKNILKISGVILLVQLVGAFYSNSIALLADTWHVFFDMLVIVVAMIVAYRVKKGGDEYSVRKAGGYIQAVLLGLVSLWIGYEAIERIVNPSEINSLIMISAALFGTLLNYWQCHMLKSSGDTHVTNKALSFHLLSDLYQSIGVVIGGILIYNFGWKILDPLISIVIALVLVRWTYTLLRDLHTGKYDGSGHCGHVHHDHH